MLDLAPDVENTVREYAQREGLTASDYIARLLQSPLTQPVTWQKPGTSSDAEKRAAVLSYLTLSREEIARRNAPSIAYFAARLAEAEAATDDEIAAANAQWQTDKQRINAHRAAMGEQPVYANTPSAE